MPDESPENLEPENRGVDKDLYEHAKDNVLGPKSTRKYNVPGGPAIEPEQYQEMQDFGQELGNEMPMRTAGEKIPGKRQAKQKVAEAAGKAATKKLAGKAAGEGTADIATAGTGGLGAVLRPLIKWATEKIVNKLLSKDWWKIILKLYWPQIATVLLIAGFALISITIIIRAYRGFWGRGQVQAASVYNDKDSAIIAGILDGDTDFLNLNLTGQFASPVGNDGNIVSFNNTLHGRSVLYPATITKHNVYRGYTNPGVGDAVDLTLANDSGSNKPVYAMFNGTVSQIADCAVLNSDPVEYNYQIQARYCHTHDIVSGRVKAGQEIAKIGKYKHVHLEVWIGNVSIHTTKKDISNGPPYGKYLWFRIKKIFGI